LISHILNTILPSFLTIKNLIYLKLSVSLNQQFLIKFISFNSQSTTLPTNQSLNKTNKCSWKSKNQKKGKEILIRKLKAPKKIVNLIWLINFFLFSVVGKDPKALLKLVLVFLERNNVKKKSWFTYSITQYTLLMQGEEENM